MKNNTIENNKANRQLKEQISLFIEYGVKKQDQIKAKEILNAHENNTMILKILKDFYSRLPECREEAVCNISKIVSRQTMYLIAIASKNFEYLYFYEGENTFYLGEKKDGIEDDEILKFFGYTSNADFLKQLTISSTLPAVSDGVEEGKTFCPSCAVAVGEIHHLGCPVEVCPWCEGQLSYCNCRFDKLGVEEIISEDQLDLFEIILNEKGRIPFVKGHEPSYPKGGDPDFPE